MLIANVRRSQQVLRARQGNELVLYISHGIRKLYVNIEAISELRI